ncbi:MAG: hypothetical protein MJZ12_10725 [Prevotella sp.]|nr:hypothetical protein [Prevotella sp.]
MKYKKQPLNPKPMRTCRIAIRLTEEEKSELEKHAQDCGITPSDYARKRILGYAPKQRLSTEELQAFLNLANARGELVHISNALQGKTQEERLRYFGNAAFMQNWINASSFLINRLTEMMAYLSDKS